MRLVLDTNIWISFLISKDMQWLDGFFKRTEFQLLFSKQLLSEFLKVAHRPKIRKYFTETKLNRLIDLFDQYGIMVDVNSSISLCRDPNDDFLLELAVDGMADHIVSGDRDLLVIGNIKSCEIITLKELQLKIG